MTSSALGAAAILCGFQEISSQTATCAFCNEEVLRGQTFFEGKGARALVDYKPAVDGHVLIIPDRHVERFEQLNPEEIAEMGEIIKKVDAAVKKIYGNTGSLLLQKNGREAGQSVPHVHFHYLPRFEGDSHLLFAWRFFTAQYFKPMDPALLEKQVADLRAEMIRNGY